MQHFHVSKNLNSRVEMCTGTEKWIWFLTRAVQGCSAKFGGEEIHQNVQLHYPLSRTRHFSLPQYSFFQPAIFNFAIEIL